MAHAHLYPTYIVVTWFMQLLQLECRLFCAYCLPLVGLSSTRSGLALVCCWVVCIWQPQDHAHEFSSSLHPCSWQAFCREDRCIRYLNWGCAWTVWSTGCLLFTQVVSHGVQLSSDWLQTPSYLLSMSAVALLPAWGWVNSGLYRSQGVGASVYLATVKPPLDILDREASWAPLGHTVHCWLC